MIMFKILLLSCDLLHVNIKHVLFVIQMPSSDLYVNIVGPNTNLYMYTTPITNNCYLSFNQSSILKVRGECKVMFKYKFNFIL